MSKKKDLGRSKTNPVAKFASRYNKAVTMRDRLKDERAGYRKHKGQDYEECSDNWDGAD